MSNPSGCSCPTPTPQALHAHFLDILPRIETHAKIRFRYLKCPGKRDDMVQETIAVCWKWYLRILEQGKDVNEFVSTFADYAVRHVCSGRKLCGQEKAKDVLSPITQQRYDIRVESLHARAAAPHDDLHGQDYQDAYEERLYDNAITPPPEQAAFRIDYKEWLATLGVRDREIIQDMALDLGTGELADKHHVSSGRISQLRREFRSAWLHFQGEPVAC